MLIPLLIMFREGTEAALIVGIIASYLRQMGQGRFLPAVWSGVALACLLCLGAGIALVSVNAEFPQKEQEFFEAIIALVTVGILTSMVFWMKRAARSMKAQLHQSLASALKSERWRIFALAGTSFLAVGREGLESTFFLLSTFQQQVGWAVPLGALLGLSLAIITGFLIYYGGVRLNLGRFFHWTSIFILFVAAGLLANALRSLHEAGLWNHLQGIAFDASSFLPADSIPGVVLGSLLGYQDHPSYGEILVYFLYLAIVAAFFFKDSNFFYTQSRLRPKKG